MWPNGLSQDLVQKIYAQAEKHSPKIATTFNNNTDARSSRISWLTGDPVVHSMLTPFIFEAAEIMGITVSINAEIQFTEYHATEGGKYDWHHDVDWNNNNGFDRKLSLTVQLSSPSDYDGGNFEFNEVEQLPKNSKELGTVVVFPSYLQHRVTPVTQGVRRSLVAWFQGPAWR
jgi:PKHD-type hydroxylase